MKIILPLKVKLQIFQVKLRSAFLFCSVSAGEILYEKPWLRHSSFNPIMNEVQFLQSCESDSVSKSLISLIFQDSKRLLRHKRL